MHKKNHFLKSGVLTNFFDLWFVPGRRVTGGATTRIKNKQRQSVIYSDVFSSITFD